MRNSRLWVLATVLSVAGVLVVLSSAAAASQTSIVGTWSSRISASKRFTIVVYPGERAGKWQIGSCAGTLRLANISNGYHHYSRIAGRQAGCAPPGVDCLKRDGTRMEDEFTAKSGAFDRFEFRRVR